MGCARSFEGGGKKTTAKATPCAKCTIIHRILRASMTLTSSYCWISVGNPGETNGSSFETSCLDVEGGEPGLAGLVGFQCVWVVGSTQAHDHQHNNKTSFCIICLIQGGWEWGWGAAGAGGGVVYPLCSPTASPSVSHDIRGENEMSSLLA